MFYANAITLSRNFTACAMRKVGLRDYPADRARNLTPSTISSMTENSLTPCYTSSLINNSWLYDHCCLKVYQERHGSHSHSNATRHLLPSRLREISATLWAAESRPSTQLWSPGWVSRAINRAIGVGRERFLGRKRMDILIKRVASRRDPERLTAFQVQVPLDPSTTYSVRDSIYWFQLQH